DTLRAFDLLCQSGHHPLPAKAIRETVPPRLPGCVLPDPRLQGKSQWFRHLHERRFLLSRNRLPPLPVWCHWLLAVQEVVQMEGLRIWIIVAWIALPTVMYGGYSLLRFLNREGALTAFQVSWFRAGHAHAGVLECLRALTRRRRFLLQQNFQQGTYSSTARWSAPGAYRVGSGVPYAGIIKYLL